MNLNKFLFLLPFCVAASIHAAPQGFTQVKPNDKNLAINEAKPNTIKGVLNSANDGDYALFVGSFEVKNNILYFKDHEGSYIKVIFNKNVKSPILGPNYLIWTKIQKDLFDTTILIEEISDPVKL